MVIDFHTHIFPDAIAAKALGNLTAVSKAETFTDATLEGLKKSMGEGGIDYSVNLPVVTRPEQFSSVNAFAQEITGRAGIISFGGIHPASPDWEEQLERLSERKVPGIKLHPDYQKIYIDDDRYVRIIRAALALGLLVSVHSGVDIGYPDPVHCTPRRAAVMLDKAGVRPEDRPGIILAHTGGYSMWDDVEKYLVGRNVFFDTSFSLGRIPDEQFIRIVRSHGAGRILFGTDSPWDSQKAAVDYLRNMDLTQEEKEQIFYRNAAGILNLEEKF